MSELEKVRANVNDSGSEMNYLPEREEIPRPRTCEAAHNSSNNATTSTSKQNLIDEEKMQRRADILYPTMDNNETKAISIQSKNNFEKPANGRISSDFEYRVAPIKGASSGHSGIDIAILIGTPIKAIADGKIIAARDGMRGYGIGVFVDHGIINGKHVISEYGHLSSFDVKIGDSIKKGQIIAKSGNTGISTGPHLHLTIRENKLPVDPKKYIEW